MYFWRKQCASRSWLTACRNHISRHSCRGLAHQGGPQIDTCRRYQLTVNPCAPASMVILRYRPIQEAHRRTWVAGLGQGFTPYVAASMCELSTRVSESSYASADTIKCNELWQDWHDHLGRANKWTMSANERYYNGPSPWHHHDCKLGQEVPMHGLTGLSM